MGDSSLRRASAFLGRLFGHSGEEASPDAVAVEKPAATDLSEDAARAWFLSRLRGLVETGGPAVAGHVQLLSLSVVRDRLGPLWPSMAPRAMRLARTIIEDRVGPRDVVLIYDDISFLILFAETAGAEARLLCIGLAQEVIAAMLGDAMIGEGRADIADELRTAIMNTKELATWLDQSESAIMPPLPQEILGATASKIPAVASTKPDAPKKPDRALAPMTGSADDRALLEEVRTRIEAHKKTATASPTAEPYSVEAYEFLPFMNVTSGAVVGFRVTWPLGTPAIPEEEENRQLLSDLDRLEAARKLFERLSTRGEEALVMVPIHFTWLRLLERRTLLRDAFGALDAQLRRHLVVDFHGLPVGMPGQRMLEIVASLHGIARATVMRLPTLADLDRVPPGTHLHAVIVDWREFPPAEPAARRLLDQHVEKASHHGFRLFVGHVETGEGLRIVRQSGARYASGLAVGPPIQDPHGLKLSPR